MTHEEQADLKRELAALDGLLGRLVPEDDLARLAMDPKRQAAAASMIGTIQLARDLLAKARSRLNGHPGLPSNEAKMARGSIGAWVKSHVPAHPVRKADFVNKAVAAGLNRSNVYFAINGLIDRGEVKQTGTIGHQEIAKK